MHFLWWMGPVGLSDALRRTLQPQPFGEQPLGCDDNLVALSSHTWQWQPDQYCADTNFVFLSPGWIFFCYLSCSWGWLSHLDILKNKLFLPNSDVFFICLPGLEWPDAVSGHQTTCFLFSYVFNVDSCLEVHSCLFLSPWAWDGWSWLAFGELGLTIASISESIWEVWTRADNRGCAQACEAE